MVSSEPFGQRAVRLGLVTSEQVRQALETQRMLAEKAGLLGEILVEMGWMDPTHYIELVQELAQSPDVADREAAQERFVTTAVDRQYVSVGHVEEARRIQAARIHKNKLIGQIMVEMGIIAPEDRDKVLGTYADDGHKV